MIDLTEIPEAILAIASGKLPSFNKTFSILALSAFVERGEPIVTHRPHEEVVVDVERGGRGEPIAPHRPREEVVAEVERGGVVPPLGEIELVHDPQDQFGDVNSPQFQQHANEGDMALIVVMGLLGAASTIAGFLYDQ